MLSKIPRILIDGREIDFVKANYSQPGILSAASLSFTVPLGVAGTENLWEKEVTLYVDRSDSKPIFRGWVNRTKKDFNQVNIFAEDGFGYMVKGGDTTVAKIQLDERQNLDGLTVGGAIIKLFELTHLDTKIKTDYIGDTSPIIGSVQKQPIRGTLLVLDIIKQLLAKPINLADQNLPKPNIAKLIDDGTYSQLVIEVESTLDSSDVSYTFTENKNITNLNIINRKIPTIVVVNGKDGVKGTFSHEGAINALDRTYLEVTNTNLDSPAACKEFGARLYQANVENKFEYELGVTEGFYLAENQVVRIQTDNKDFSGNYRIVGKSISFGSATSIGITINRKPPTLAEYISSRDN
tara:strand:+ start:12455 stop:13510 length:1056 start_codon:yes stop_codon:yes gene_type:complete